MTTISLEVLGHPFGKQRPRARKDGHIYTPDQTATEEGNVRAQAVHDIRRLEAQTGTPFQPLTGPLKLTLLVYVKPPQKLKWPFPAKKPDIDNAAKLIMDSLNGVLWLDDAQICALHVLKQWDTRPRVVIVLEEMVDWGA